MALSKERKQEIEHKILVELLVEHTSMGVKPQSKRELPNEAKRLGIDLKEAEELYQGLLLEVVTARTGATSVDLKFS